jgi:hydroxymethylglutaryl-CoA lyase
VFEALPPRVSVYEVGPRDGLQNEVATVPLEGKLALIEALVAAGLRRIEAGSFVSPKWIPQLADSDQLLARLPKRPDVVYSSLVPNLKGLERALAAGATEVAVFLSSDETHSQKNIHMTIDESLAEGRKVAEGALAKGLSVRGYVSMVWGTPEGHRPTVEAVRRIAGALLETGCYQVSLGDTVGVGTPRQTREILEQLLAVFPAPSLALHLHDTRGTALANALVGLELGIETFDSSVGGLGGCPYAPGASGNLATEDLVYMLSGMGIDTGVDLGKLVAAGELAQKLVGRKLTGRVFQAVLGQRERAYASGVSVG